MAQRTRQTDHLVEKLLTVVSNNGGVVTDACKSVNLSRMALYSWLRDDEKFAERFEEARDRGIDALEDEARRRALNGTEEPIYYQGEVCGHVFKKSDAMMSLLLKAHRKKFRDRQEISGPEGRPLSSNVHIFIPDNGRPDKPLQDDGEVKTEGESKVEIRPKAEAKAKAKIHRLRIQAAKEKR